MPRCEVVSRASEELCGSQGLALVLRQMLVIGGCGFLGHRIVEAILAAAQPVIREIELLRGRSRQIAGDRGRARESAGAALPSMLTLKILLSLPQHRPAYLPPKIHILHLRRLF